MSWQKWTENERTQYPILIFFSKIFKDDLEIGLFIQHSGSTRRAQHLHVNWQVLSGYIYSFVTPSNQRRVQWHEHLYGPRSLFPNVLEILLHGSKTNCWLGAPWPLSSVALDHITYSSKISATVRILL